MTISKPAPADGAAPERDVLAAVDLGHLSALVDAIVPADDYPGASGAGSLRYLRRAFAGEQPAGRLASLLERIAARARSRGIDIGADPVAALDALGDDDDLRWFAALVCVGYYADAPNGGNDGEKSWELVRWKRGPAGWPAEFLGDEDRAGLADFSGLAPRYDVVVIGSGAGGGAAASVFAGAGRRVLVVEAGGWPDDAQLVGDHLRNARASYGFAPFSGPSTDRNPRVVDIGGRGLTLTAADLRWGNNASTFGGGTRVYGAQAWRFTADDFRMATRYGVPDGSALADWPIGYEDLEPYYSRAEWVMGVAGDSGGDVTSMPRSRDYPMAPLPLPDSARPLQDGARRLGLHTTPVPLLVNSVPHGGRAACVRCAECAGFACPVGAKGGSHNTTLPAAIATGRCTVVVETKASRLVTGPSGRVVAVELVTGAGGRLRRRTIAAGQFVIAAGAVESARLLLNSPSDTEPRGLGNNHDQVGRHLQGHVYAGATALFAEDVVDLAGPGPSIATCDYRHGNPGIVGGGMLANEFVPTPASTYTSLAQLGLIPWWGQDSKDGMRTLARRMLRVIGPVQEVTSAGSRVRVDARVRDRFGIPVPRLEGTIHAEDVRTAGFLRARAAEWLKASGAERVVPHPLPALGAGPSAGQHQAGTCRMGEDPATSVCDPHGRVWGHDNLIVADGSIHVTNGGVNPVLSIAANALRVAELAARR